jgi:site-specific DNA recombinase
MSRHAAIYCRISADAEGQGLGVARQRRDCLTLVKSKEWPVYRVYTDNDRSAYSGKSRPEYEQMLTDLQAGLVDAVVVWDVDRLTRSPAELERIIDLAERHGIALASVGGEIDLSTEQGRLMARVKGSVARYEVEQQSRRLRRKFQERAEEGRPHGKVPFGWIRLNGNDVLQPDQAAVVQEIADRVIAAESLRSITLDFQLREIPTPREQKRWHPVTVRQLVLRARNAGLRVHRGAVIGQGLWEPIFSVETYERVQAILADPARRSSNSGRNRYLLSGIAICGKCGEPLRVIVAHKQRPAAYTCSVGYCVRRRQQDVDEVVTRAVIGRLSKPDAVTLLSPKDDKEATSRVSEAAAMRAKLDLAADQFADGLIEASQLERITARLRPRLRELESQIQSAVSAPELVDVLSPDIGSRWAELPLDRQRAIVRLLMQVRILPIGRTGRAEFDPAGVAIDWKTSPPAKRKPRGVASVKKSKALI